MRADKKGIARLVFLGYCLLMLWLLFGQRLIGEFGSGYNLIPFRTIRNYLYVGFHTTQWPVLQAVIVNLLGNVVMFVPLGYLLPVNWICFRRFFVLMLWVLCVISSIELLQLLTRLGSLDVDDLVLNLTGTSIGYLLWRLGSRMGRCQDVS